jgi:osmotically-inducible protein OsmY
MKQVMGRESGQLPYPFGGASNDEQVLTEVLNALHWHTGVPSETVKVDVKGGHVTLSGFVSQDFERDLAERSAQDAPGVVEVTNNIKIES